MDKNELETIVKMSHNKADCIRNLKWNENGQMRNKLSKLINEYGIDTSHFDPYYSFKQNTKYKKIIKVCPVCSEQFETKSGHSKEKTTCSNSCSNTYFNGIRRNLNVTNYRTVCFRHHKKECVICGESKIVGVHHLDHDTKNNKPDNLIPMCPTHHQYWHSRYRNLVESKVMDYIEGWKSSN